MEHLDFSKRRTDLRVAILIILTNVLLGYSQTTGRCLDHIPEVHPKKYLYYEGKSLNITLEVSHRITHQLTTNVFKIFLQEVLGYPKVEIVRQENHFQVVEAIERLAGEEKESRMVPTSMINVEVWVPSNMDVTPLIDLLYVNEGGSIASAGRFGWFIPRELTAPLKPFNKKWMTTDQDVHWTFFKDQDFVSIFDITDLYQLNYLRNNSLLDNETKSFHCDDPACIEGVFTPQHCKSTSSKRVNCAYLLSSYFNDTSFVMDDINNLKLYVKVIWLGPNLKRVVSRLKENFVTSHKSLAILHWTPSDVIVKENKYISVVFPHCQLPSSFDTVGCKYELNRLEKFSWSKLANLAQPAYEALHSFKFDDDQFDYLLQLYNNHTNKPIYDIACMWMRTNDMWWKPWKRLEKFPPLYIGGIFPMQESSYNGKGIVIAANMAKEAVNKNKTILPDYELKLLVNNGMCQADTVMKAFIDYIVDKYYSKMVGVLGPACSDTVEPLAGVSKLYGTMVISYSAEGSSFSDRDKYPYFFRTIGENKHYEHVYLKLFKQFKWKRVAALTEDGQKYTEYISNMEKLLEENDIKMISNKKFPRQKKVGVMTKYLEDLKRNRAKIIIADVNDEVARTVMCDAYKLGMTAREGYVWFLPKWLNATFYNTDYFNKPEGGKENINCTTAQMIKAITGYFALSHAFYASSESIMQENITVGEWKKNYELRTQKIGEISNYGGFAYDAVWTYALALDRLTKTDPEAISDLHSSNTTVKLVKLIKETDFYGVSGHIKFRGGPSRISVMNIMQWYDNNTHIVGQFLPNLKDNSPDIMGGNLTLNSSRLKWFTPDFKPPDDGSEDLSTCILSGFAELLDVSCEIAVTILNLIVGLIFIIIVSTTLFVLKRKYDKRVKLTQKYMQSLGLEISMNLTGHGKWELPRECVMINRKLGEGAFGAVYGGEGNIPEQGWISIAVKTLKVGSSREERIDFLAEAEAMKFFDHKNVVKLIGVCTETEPIYTVMEFMLYGDLRRFLLERRLLANGNTENTEISNERLTSMALDLARAVSYLHEIRFVHRDIAARNCLVNSVYSLKLGDFGMTRPVSDNNYYRFCRKGMLPVRWMSPESLTEGTFAPSSDVWSYGVVLYEMVTFGSVPYGSLTNEAVWDYIRAKKRFEIPLGVKPQLRALMKSCFKLDPQARPCGKEIVDFLANNPRLLHPCLDMPLTSVPPGDTGQLEVTFPDQFRKSSSASFKPPQSPTIPNGVTTPVTDSPSKIARQQSIPSNGVCIQMDSNCLREPLLPLRSNQNSFGLGKFVTLQHANGRSNSECEEDVDFSAPTPANGHAITQL